MLNYVVRIVFVFVVCSASLLSLSLTDVRLEQIKDSLAQAIVNQDIDSYVQALNDLDYLDIPEATKLAIINNTIAAASNPPPLALNFSQGFEAGLAGNTGATTFANVGSGSGTFIDLVNN